MEKAALCKGVRTESKGRSASFAEKALRLFLAVVIAVGLVPIFNLPSKAIAEEGDEPVFYGSIIDSPVADGRGYYVYNKEGQLDRQNNILRIARIENAPEEFVLPSSFDILQKKKNGGYDTIRIDATILQDITFGPEPVYYEDDEDEDEDEAGDENQGGGENANEDSEEQQFSDTPVTSIDLTNCPSLTSVALLKLPDLESLDISKSKNIGSIDVEECPSVTFLGMHPKAKPNYLGIQGSSSTSFFDPSDSCWTKLDWLTIHESDIESLDVSNLESVTGLTLIDSNIEQITGLSVLSKLEYLELGGNNISTIDIDDIPEGVKANNFRITNNNITDKDLREALIAKFGEENVLPQNPDTKFYEDYEPRFEAMDRWTLEGCYLVGDSEDFGLGTPDFGCEAWWDDEIEDKFDVGNYEITVTPKEDPSGLGVVSLELENSDDVSEKSPTVHFEALSAGVATVNVKYSCEHEFHTFSVEDTFDITIAAQRNPITSIAGPSETVVVPFVNCSFCYEGQEEEDGDGSGEDSDGDEDGDDGDGSDSGENGDGSEGDGQEGEEPDPDESDEDSNDSDPGEGDEGDGSETGEEGDGEEGDSEEGEPQEYKPSIHYIWEDTVVKVCFYGENSTVPTKRGLWFRVVSEDEDICKTSISRDSIELIPVSEGETNITVSACSEETGEELVSTTIRVKMLDVGIPELQVNPTLSVDRYYKGETLLEIYETKWVMDGEESSSPYPHIASYKDDAAYQIYKKEHWDKFGSSFQGDPEDMSLSMDPEGILKTSRWSSNELVSSKKLGSVKVSLVDAWGRPATCTVNVSEKSYADTNPEEGGMSYNQMMAAKTKASKHLKLTQTDITIYLDDEPDLREYISGIDEWEAELKGLGLQPPEYETGVVCRTQNGYVFPIQYNKNRNPKKEENKFLADVCQGRGDHVGTAKVDVYANIGGDYGGATDYAVWAPLSWMDLTKIGTFNITVPAAPIVAEQTYDSGLTVGLGSGDIATKNTMYELEKALEGGASISLQVKGSAEASQNAGSQEADAQIQTTTTLVAETLDISAINSVTKQTLLDQTSIEENEELSEELNLVVRIKLTDKMKKLDLATLKVVYVDSNGEISERDTWVDGEYLCFSTNHFSTYKVFGDKPTIDKVELSAEAFTYNGSQIASPTVESVKCGSQLIDPDDYDVTYPTGCINAGTYNVKVKAKDESDYQGEVTKSFKINPMKLNASMVTNPSNYIYDGKKKSPTVTVKANGTTLKNGTDYTLSYSANTTNAGTCYVYVKGAGNYSETITKSFKINAANLSSAVISGATGGTYNGSAMSPNVTVKMNGATLKKGTDYTVTYANNVNAGTATVTVTGTNKNYTGSKSATFAIAKAAQSISGGSASKSFKFKKVKKKAQKFSVAASAQFGAGVSFSVSKYVKSGKITPAKAKKYVKVDAAGNVTVKKGAPKGTYKLKLALAVPEGGNYTGAAQEGSLTIKVK